MGATPEAEKANAIAGLAQTMNLTAVQGTTSAEAIAVKNCITNLANTLTTAAASASTESTAEAAVALSSNIALVSPQAATAITSALGTAISQATVISEDLGEDVLEAFTNVEAAPTQRRTADSNFTNFTLAVQNSLSSMQQKIIAGTTAGAAEVVINSQAGSVTKISTTAKLIQTSNSPPNQTVAGCGISSYGSAASNNGTVSFAVLQQNPNPWPTSRRTSVTVANSATTTFKVYDKDGNEMPNLQAMSPAATVTISATGVDMSTYNGCASYDTTTTGWSTTGITKSSTSTSNQLVCKTSHLTTFAPVTIVTPTPPSSTLSSSSSNMGMIIGLSVGLGVPLFIFIAVAYYFLWGNQGEPQAAMEDIEMCATPPCRPEPAEAPQPMPRQMEPWNSSRLCC